MAEISPEELRANLDAEQATVRKLQILFGRWWPHYALPYELRWTLYTERDQCPYCSTPLQHSTAPGVHNIEGHVRHIDHMDPLSRGGEESFRNAICVCARCNTAKGRRLFADWLQRIPAKNQASVREIYVQKLGRAPEGFEPGPRQPRLTSMRMELGFDEHVLRTMFPKPVVHGPPRKAAES